MTLKTSTNGTHSDGALRGGDKQEGQTNPLNTHERIKKGHGRQGRQTVYSHVHDRTFVHGLIPILEKETRDEMMYEMKCMR